MKRIAFVFALIVFGFAGLAEAHHRNNEALMPFHNAPLKKACRSGKAQVRMFTGDYQSGILYVYDEKKVIYAEIVTRRDRWGGSVQRYGWHRNYGLSRFEEFTWPAYHYAKEAKQRFEWENQYLIQQCHQLPYSP